MNFNLTTHPVAVIALLSAASLTACNDTNQSVGQKVDDAVATTERKADDVKADIKEGAADVKGAMDDAAAASKKVISDAAITARINAELAKDSGLSALKINVDSKDGRVALNGTAPNASARERATTLAATVDGVKSVDNQLMVR